MKKIILVTLLVLVTLTNVFGQVSQEQVEVAYEEAMILAYQIPEEARASEELLNEWTLENPELAKDIEEALNKYFELSTQYMEENQ